MPAVLTHKSIMLLARERLADIHAAIEAKIRTGTHITDLERKLSKVAKEAYDIMSSPPHPETDLPGQLFGRPVGDRVSKFAVMGAMGPDITGFSAILTPGQSWVFDTVHKSYPDSDREAINARTCDFGFEIWRLASAAINASNLPDATKQKYLKNMRAYVLGHLCHVAGDVVSHPFINDIEWHDGRIGQRKLDHADGEASHDAQVARLVLLRGSTREGQAWDGWWPTVEEVPPQFFQAYADALEEIYTARSKRRRGFGEYEKLFAELEPQELSTGFVKDGYSLYRGAILPVAYGFGFWSWFGFLLLPVLSAMLLPVLAAALPRARVDLGDEPPEDEPDPGDRVAFELLMLPLALGALNATVYGIYVAALTTHGAGTRTALGLIYAIASTILGIVFFATVGRKDLPGRFRWPVLFGIPALGGLIEALAGFVDIGRGHRGARGGQALIYAMPFLFLVVGFVCWLIFRIPVAAEDDAGIDTGAFWVAAAIWLIIMIGVWIGMSFFLRDVRIPEKADDFAAVKKHHVRLFDDTTLFIDPKVATDKLPDLFFPSGRRPLLKLHWEGAGDLFVRVDRFQIVFSFAEAENATSQFVPAPVGPMLVSEYLHFLQNSVKDPDGNAGKLKVAFAFPEDSDYELPPGATFASHGDAKGDAKPEEQAAESAKFRKIGKAAGDAFVLFHAPKRMQAIRFGRTGPIADPFGLNETLVRQSEASTGYGYVHDALAGTESDALMSQAGDFAALLCLGGATHLSTAAPPPSKIYQVFRNWNLDRRRVNEWRMLVAGSAFSEKAGHPENYDDRMLDRFGPADKAAWKSPLFAAGADVVARAERTALQMGWVPLLRAWMDIVRRPGQDPLAATSFRPENPTNHELTRAMAWLLDMTDPVAAP